MVAISISFSLCARSCERTYDAITIPTRKAASTRAIPFSSAEVATSTRLSTTAILLGTTTYTENPSMFRFFQ